MILYILDISKFEKSEYCTEVSKHKKHHAAGQFLLRCVLGNEVYEKAEFAKRDHGKPYIVGTPIHYNISHSEQYAVLVTANSEVGVDVQEKRPARMETLAKRFFSKEEWLAFSKCDGEKEKKDLFFHIWCRKEAYGKYLGTGLNTKVLQTNVLVDLEDVLFIEYEAVEGYQISICCGKEESIEEVISVFEGL
ncbi:MAG: 4'-phosphopantetheinyl transferase superfamily protein [Lachnospiraceae bacterium]|nr:4'-phosphopantetheinyl transferase superfamily protein [Lachnospiraceae bacterium]